MGLLKTYSIINDITAGTAEQSTLHKEIDSSGFVTTLETLEIDGDVLNLYGEALADETALDALVLNHGGADVLKVETKAYVGRSEGRNELIHKGTLQFVGYFMSLGDIQEDAEAKVTEVSTEVSQHLFVYILGNKTPLINAINASSLTYMDAAAKAYLISTLDYILE